MPNPNYQIFVLPPKYVLLVLIIFLLLGLSFRLLTISLQYKYTALIGADLAKSLNVYTEVYISLWYAKKIGFLSK